MGKPEPERNDVVRRNKRKLGGGLSLRRGEI